MVCNETVAFTQSRQGSIDKVVDAVPSISRCPQRDN